MKRIITLTLISLCSCAIIGCSLSSNALDRYEADQIVYINGQEDAVLAIREGAQSDYTHYVDADVLEEIIRRHFGDDADDIRDMILFHPDVEIYSATDIVDEAIDNSGL